MARRRSRPAFMIRARCGVSLERDEYARRVNGDVREGTIDAIAEESLTDSAMV